jgi:fatty acid desaturase
VPVPSAPAPTPAAQSGRARAPSAPARPRRGHYKRHLGDLPRRLLEAVPPSELRKLHRRSGLRHLLLAARQVALAGATAVALVHFQDPRVWVPLAVLQGFWVLGFVILLHEVVHETVFRRRRPRLSRALALLYALPSAISASQFRRWHLDHHDELGSTTDDPKRAHLSPKRNARWLKLAYMTPALFVIYARAAGRAAQAYPRELRRRVRVERLANVAVHLAAVVLLYRFAGGDALLRAYVVPLFLAFPFAFTLNRLGQHYWVDPGDPAKWGTRVDANPVVNLLFLNSSYHLEHHYFPSVPLHRLPALNRRLRPFWDGIGHPSRGYGQLLWKWLVENRAPHTDW